MTLSLTYGHSKSASNESSGCCWQNDVYTTEEFAEGSLWGVFGDAWAIVVPVLPAEASTMEPRFQGLLHTDAWGNK